MQDLRSRLGDVLRRYCGEVESGSNGFKITCPYHADNSPSAVVFYDTGTFFCFSCGTKAPLAHGLRKIGVPESTVKELTVKVEPELKTLTLKPLLGGDLCFKPQAEVTTEASVGIVREDPWPENWGYRQIRAKSLEADSRSKICKVFRPSLVRLWRGSKGKRHQERYQRLCLHYGAHQIFARLSSEQEIKYYNSHGLTTKDLKLHPFGLASYDLPTNQAGLFVVEGPYDWMRLTQNLEDLKIAHHFSVVALLGVSHWEAFFKKLELRLSRQMNHTLLILSLDNDRAGKELDTKAKNDCTTRLLWSKDRFVTFPYSSQDPGKASVEETKEGLNQIGFSV